MVLGAKSYGVHAIARKSGRSAQLWSRNQKDFTRPFTGVAIIAGGLVGD